MTKPPYALLRSKYPDKRSVVPGELYAWIGYPEYADNILWANTCAIRLSLALVRSGVTITPGHLTVKTGQLKGSRIEQNQKRLSDFLVRTFGQPEKYEGGGVSARNKIGNRHGIVSFFNLHGATDAQGHIDLVAPDNFDTLMCEEDCFWSAVEVWFWPLK